MAAEAVSPRPGGRAAGQVLSAPRASVAASLLCPTARLPGCRSAYGVLEVDGLPAGETAVDAALGRSSRRFQLPESHALPAPLRAPGSAMGISASRSTVPGSCSRIAGATMIASFLLLVSAREGGPRAAAAREQQAPRSGSGAGPRAWTAGGAVSGRLG